ncbi:MAG: glycerol-3-phosphate 1-O-acyltransferase PlsY [Gammaproteobacteria bacterium]|nr:glycerol-3-phosphate 1-O-acyltransferase PlsY [Gammaproteobacteria bacterium]
MNAVVLQIAAVIAAYLLGSINSAVLSSKALHLPDPRTLGSGNPGATNVLRTGSKSAAAITLLGDVLKGFLPVLLATTLTDDPRLVAAVGLAALLGHIFPVYYRFQGGKGVATTLGVLLAMDWLLGGLWALTWVATALVFRYSSVAAMTAMVVTLVLAVAFRMDAPWTIGLLGLFTALIFWRHTSNIRDLRAGREVKFGKK